MKQRLELTWIGKGEEDVLEPRILIENPEYSYGDPNTGNLLIHGDNLLALKSLVASGYAGKVKCIYIDPPYNTGAAFEHYDDNVEHSIWLSLMKQRLELLRELLAPDGVIFVQIDDTEMPYLSVIMDEIFGRDNRINTICVNMSNTSGVKITAAIRGARFPKVKEYVLLYARNKEKYRLIIPRKQKEKWDPEYNLIIPSFTTEHLQAYSEGLLQLSDIADLSICSLKQYMKKHGIKDTLEWKQDNAFRIFASKPNAALLKRASEFEFETEIALVANASGDKKLVKTDFNRETKTARIELVSAEINGSTYLGDHWEDIVTTGGIALEGAVSFPNGKKPEKLIHRIIECSTSPGDLVLDSFLGSGTTAAVAHKMGRRYIGIELGDHAYTHCVPRLQKVIDGTDQGGITASAAWTGGGGFRFYELAPTLLNEDEHGVMVISPEYNAQMLAAAMALHEGFCYAPDPEVFWKQGHSTESDYIYTTTQHLTIETLEYIDSLLGEGETLLICCTSHGAGLVSRFPRITVKHIPRMLLGRCAFDPAKSYDLNIITLPEVGPQDEEDDE